jgi:hypothetical protein
MGMNVASHGIPQDPIKPDVHLQGNIGITAAPQNAHKKLNLITRQSTVVIKVTRILSLRSIKYVTKAAAPASLHQVAASPNHARADRDRKRNAGCAGVPGPWIWTKHATAADLEPIRE